jgi:hypothetical protein
MRSPPQIVPEPLPQAHGVVMSIEQLVDHERQLIAVMVCESSAGGPGGGSVSARYQHDFSSNYTSLTSLSSATATREAREKRETASHAKNQPEIGVPSVSS